MDKRSLIYVVILAVCFYLVQEFYPKGPQVQPPKTAAAAPVEEKSYQETKTVPQPIDETDQQETFYVLENSYLQLVFSSKGGGLSEINLPFHSPSNPKSVVNEINFDRKIAQTSKPNAYFPLTSYYIFSQQQNKIIKEDKGKFSGYYPLLRRDIIDKETTNDFYALTITDNANLKDATYKMTRLEKDQIELELSQNGKQIVKTYKISEEIPYMIELKIKIDGTIKNLYLSSGIPEVELTSGNYDPAIKVKTTKIDKSQVEKISLPKTTTTVSSFYPDWICNSNGFFAVLMNPIDDIAPGYKAKNIPGEIDPTRLTLIDPQYNLYPAKKYPGYETFLPLKNSKNEMTFHIFAGPLAKSILTSLDDIYSKPLEGYNPQYVKAISFHGWFSFISEPFAKFMFFLMNLFYKTTHSWGLSIIILTIILRLMLYPLNAWSIKSQTKMQQFAPLIESIKKKYEKNPQKARVEIMNIYREKGINPMTGCLPLVIQMPFLFGMFDLLKSTFELRGASFIPGWINNLCAPDVLFSWNYPIFFIGTEFHLLPVLNAVVMFFQQKLNSAVSKDKSNMSDQQRQMVVMNNIMTIFITILFYNLPAGLNIYWFCSMLLGVVQQYVNTRKLKKNPSLI